MSLHHVSTHERRALVWWLVVPIKAFSYTRGSPKQLKSSVKSRRFFCSECGTHVTCTNKTHPEIVDVTLGSVDKPQAFTPTFHVFEDTKLPLVMVQAQKRLAGCP